MELFCKQPLVHPASASRKCRLIRGLRNRQLPWSIQETTARVTGLQKQYRSRTFDVAHSPLRSEDGPAGVGRASPGTVMPGAGKVAAGGGGRVVVGSVPGSSGPSKGIPPLTGAPIIGPVRAGWEWQSHPGAAPIGIGVLSAVPTNGGQHSGGVRRKPSRLKRPSRGAQGPRSNRGVAHPLSPSRVIPKLAHKSCRRQSMRDPPGQSVASTLAR